jgi:hypothetical protein
MGEYGKIWENMGKYERIWENMVEYGRIRDLLLCHNNIKMRFGRNVDETVSSRLDTAVARVRARIKSCGICVQSGSGADFLRVLPFPLPLIHSTYRPQSSPSIIQSWCNRLHERAQ